ncbi:hypothetical protein L218DRAFT_1005705 [Marasmius fiardii PR-910]|nr:hypothetical protein L218DRAFT_1005705 [Marasmius fiardii PR-910]
MALPYSYVFLWPTGLNINFYEATSQFGNKFFPAGIYPKCPCVIGDNGTHWLPITVQVRTGKAQRFLDLLQPLINANAHVNDINLITTSLQNSEGFQQACSLMEEDSGFFWSLLLAKNTALFYDYPSTNSSWRATRIESLLAQTFTQFSETLDLDFSVMTEQPTTPLSQRRVASIAAAPSPARATTPVRVSTPTPASPRSMALPATRSQAAPTAVSISSPLAALQQTHPIECCDHFSPAPSSALPTLIQEEEPELHNPINHHALHYFNSHGYLERTVGVILGLYSTAISMDDFQKFARG